MIIEFKNAAKTIVHCFCILIVSVLLGTVLLAIVYKLPTNVMRANLAQDTSELSKEGVYPALHGLFSNTLDNFTDSLMLGAAVYDNDEPFLNKMVNVYHPGGYENPVQDLVEYLENSDNGNYGSYARYWHGYLIFLKPILCFTDYLIWRTINHILQIILIIAVVILLIRRLSWKCIFPIMAAVLFLRPNVIFYTMHFSTIFYVSIFAVLFLALFYGRKDNKWLICFYFSVGIAANYFDYLSYPSVSLGLCLVVCLMLEQNASFTENLSKTIKYSIAWTLGYAGMWVSKWTLGSILIRDNLYRDAITSIITRSSSNAYGGSISRFDAVISNLQMVSEVVSPALFFGVIILLCVIAIWQWRREWKKFASYAANMAVIFAIPFVWFLVLSNHSYVHQYCTFRTLATAVAAAFALVWKIDRLNYLKDKKHL